jgi:predicted dienelactone hydrolase
MKKIYLFLLIFTLATSSWAQNFAVGNTTITFNDPSRSGGFGSGGGPGRQIQTEIYYPANAAGANVPLANGTFPVIVFGHGFAMSWDAYANLWNAFASKGYIIAFPRTEGGLLPAPSHNNFGLDLAIVEVKLQALNTNSSSIFYQKVKNSSAIMGHSMGGGATFLGAANNSSPTLKAVVGLAPAETNPSAIAAAANVSVDALILSGSSDGVTPPASNHQPIYNNLPSTCKTFLSITNGSHCYFANTNFNCDFGELTTGTGSLSRAAQQDITADYVGLWLDFKLKGSCLAWDEFLDSLVVSSRVVEQQSCCYGYLQPNVNLSGNASFCCWNK